MPNEGIVDRVKDYINHSKSIKAIGMAQLSPRAVVVMDDWDDTDVYFDSASYRIIYPRFWRNGLFPRRLKGTSLGTLPGTGHAPPIRGYDAALKFAKQHLEPIVAEANYYPKPVEAPVEAE